MKHNNVVPNAHFHKEWQLRVRTWFNQPMRKKRRRTQRQMKAARVAPRPVDGMLRPVVHCPTVKYNMKERLGRGFTLEELKEAGVLRKMAKTIGIAVDHRRKNRSVESFQQNVQRLKEYKSRLIVFPKRVGKAKSGDSDAADLTTATQLTGKLMPPVKASSTLEARAVTDEEKSSSVYAKLCTERMNVRNEGMRKKVAAEKAAAEE
uniref:60S ribosomal protein L13 n=1 Tax=Timspurckia oligopyrenoides TaxID=708627 RepID=A0A7S1EQE0_9RHOD|mmetsp:Transcript_12682/g.22814  ORF Transcript_12682/g.22814 Transcript_12682/m.22814 type:complete len:206 (+) Transcript_12682:76-693(+)|eukprot:CAMPEP_0182447920 /NCGR_PEP_ID=MMETSP1172-20130603/21653_1 /TAXON_ID=708627 /ORGANISM="Timspurckia oligopyrenoides, Strain CCMP3278" /LENGTH=205 /DNA_ID=CAMNT_0024644565 /DNA_START=74 /DNA_END=691 /DNA_ORIENTATION=+